MADYSIIKSIRTDKPEKKNGKYPIYLRIRVKGEETKVPTGIDVFLERWDNKKKEPKDKALQIQLNKKVEELDLHINRALADGQILTMEMVKNFYKGKKKVRPESQSFYDYYLEFVERKRNEGINPETIRVYMTTYRVLKEFKENFLISDINLKLIEEFDEHMRVINNNAPGGRHPKHKNIRTVILDMKSHDIPVLNPYDKGFFKMPQSKAKEVFLDETELNLMRDLRSTLPHNSTDYKVLQMYLFSCYCGLRFSDVIELEWSHIDFDQNLIVKIMKKTKNEVITPLFTYARAVVLELSENKSLIGTNKNVFYGYKEPTVNRTLKKLTKLVGIEKEISYHSSRHTFATRLVQDNVDVYTISRYLGHKDITMTMRYLKYNLSIASNLAKNIKTFG